MNLRRFSCGILLASVFFFGCDGKPKEDAPSQAPRASILSKNSNDVTQKNATEAALPSLPDVSQMEPDVAALLQKLHREAVAQPNNANAWGRLGMGLDVHGEYAAAIPCYKRAESLEPRDFRWSYFLAWVMGLAEADPALVIAQYKFAIAKNPGYATAHARLGSALFTAGQSAAAASSLQKALALDSSLVQVHRDLGQALLSLGRTEEAVEHLEIARREMPDDTATVASLAQAYRRSGRIEEARAVQEGVTSQTQRDSLPDPARAEVTAMGVSSFVRIFRAQELMRAQRFAEAIAELKDIEKIKAEDATLQNALGQSYYRLGQIEIALQHLTRAVALDSSLAGAHFTLGEIYRTRGQMAEAVRHLRIAVEHDATKGNMFAALGTGLAHLKEYNEAEDAFRKAVERDYDTALLRKNWGAIYFQREDYANAIAQYERAINLDPTFVDAHFFLGMCYEKLGEPAKAIERYQTVLALRPGQAQALARIQALAAENP